MSVYFLPSLQLSSVIESETNSLLYYYIQIDNIFRTLFALPSPLSHHFPSSPLSSSSRNTAGNEVFSGNALRILDNLLLAHEVVGARVSGLTRAIGLRTGVGVGNGSERRRLRGAIARVLISYRMTQQLSRRADTPFVPTSIAPLIDLAPPSSPPPATSSSTSTNGTKGDEHLLRRLWKAYRPAEDELPDEELRDSKRWQELGFQGKDPTTDFRRTGMLTYALALILDDLTTDLWEQQNRHPPVFRRDLRTGSSDDHSR